MYASIFCLIFVFFGVLAAPPGVADAFDPESLAIDEAELLFDDIPSVFGASKYEQKVTEAPSRISIVTAAEIQRYGYQTISDVLAGLPGFFTTNDRNYNYTGVRGFSVPGDYDTRLLQLVNGHRVNDNVYGSSFNDHSFPVDLDLIERIEVIRGPSSSIYGSGAFFGVINIVTKEGRDLSGWELSASAGSMDSNEAQVSYGNRLANGAEYLVSASFGESDGEDRLYFAEYDDPTTNNGIARNVDGEKYSKLFARATSGDFSLEAGHSKREKDIPTGSYGTVFNSPANSTMDSRTYVSAQYQTLTQGGDELSARLAYDRYVYEGDYLYDYGIPGDPYISLNNDEAEGRAWSAQLQWRKRLEKHHVVFGAEYQSSFQEEQKNYDLDGVYLDSAEDSSVWAVFLQDDIYLSESISLNLGLRLDDYSSFGTTVNPRAALIWSPIAGTTLKAIYGEAFRAPNAFERYYNDSELTWKPSIALDPETIQSEELVLEQQLGDGWRGVFSVYKNRIEDLIALSTDPQDDLLIFINQGDAEAEGVEAEIEKRWPTGMSGAVSYTYQDAEDSQSGQRLVNYATHMGKLKFNMPLLQSRLFASIEAAYESGRLTLAGEDSDSRTLVNFVLTSAQLVEGLTTTLGVYNLFDEAYSDPGSEEHEQNLIEQNGRTLTLSLNYAF